MWSAFILQYDTWCSTEKSTCVLSVEDVIYKAVSNLYFVYYHII